MEVRYLGVSQKRLGAIVACPTISAYMALYLLYSDAPLAESIVTYIRHGATVFLMDTEKHKGRFEDIVHPYNRYPQHLSRLMRIDDTLDCNGLMLASPEMYTSLPNEFANRDFQLVHGIRPALERIVNAVTPVAARAFGFARNGRTLSGVVRKSGANAVRFDFVDSHDCILPSCPPRDNVSSAMWVTCHSLNDAVRFLEECYPPAKDLRGMNVTKDDPLEVTASALYSLTVFRPEFSSSADAEAAGRHAAESNAPYYCNVRGVDYDGGTLDEVAFCKDSLLIDGFFPVALKGRSFLVMATTPGPQHSLFMNLISLKNEQGQAKMHVVRSGQPCEACMKTKEPWTCIHNLEERPPWRSQAKEERLAWLFPDKNAFLREQLGVVREDTVRPFIPRFIAELRARPLTRETHPPECIFLTADSASGGKCEFAVLAGYFVAMNHLVLIYGDAFTVPEGDPRVQRERIQASVKIIRSNVMFSNVPIVFVPENAPANAGPVLHEYLLPFPNVFTMAEWNSHNNTLGVKATDRNQQTEWLGLTFYTGALSYSEHMTTYYNQKLDDYKDGLERQAMCWERVPTVSKDPTKPVHWHWTAKHKAGNDDRIVTLLMMWWHKVFYEHPRYADVIRSVIMPRRMLPGMATFEEQQAAQAAVLAPRANVVNTSTSAAVARETALTATEQLLSQRARIDFASTQRRTLGEIANPSAGSKHFM